MKLSEGSLFCPKYSDGFVTEVCTLKIKYKEVLLDPHHFFLDIFRFASQTQNSQTNDPTSDELLFFLFLQRRYPVCKYRTDRSTQVPGGSLFCPKYIDEFATDVYKLKIKIMCSEIFFSRLCTQKYPFYFPINYIEHFGRN